MQLRTDPKEWHRMIFPISQCNGKISHKIEPSLFFEKIDDKELFLFFILIEKQTGKFFYARLYTKYKVVLIIVLILTTTFSLYSFLFKKNIISGCILSFFSIVVIFLFIVGFNSFFKKLYVHSFKKAYIIINEINQKTYASSGFHMMLDPNLKYICLYIVPSYISATAKIDLLISENDKKKENENSFIDKSKKELELYKDISENRTLEILSSYFETKQKCLGLLNNKYLQ